MVDILEWITKKGMVDFSCKPGRFPTASENGLWGLIVNPVVFHTLKAWFPTHQLLQLLRVFYQYGDESIVLHVHRSVNQSTFSGSLSSGPLYLQSVPSAWSGSFGNKRPKRHWSCHLARMKDLCGDRGRETCGESLLLRMGRPWAYLSLYEEWISAMLHPSSPFNHLGDTLCIPNLR